MKEKERRIFWRNAQQLFGRISPMIYALTGTVQRLDIPNLTIDVQGVRYLVSVSYPVWESAQDGSTMTVTILTFLREDRLELYGFSGSADRNLFAALLNISGVGPKMGLELLSIQRSLLAEAVIQGDAGTLTEIKGVGRKTAEKLLVDLKSLFEKHPEWASVQGGGKTKHAALDADAVSALTSLGYDQSSAVEALKRVPVSLKKTEERVAAALRSL